MRHNNKSFVFIITIAGLLGTACQKTIDKTPISSLTTSNYWKTATDAESGLTGAYNSLYQQFYIWDYMTNGDVQADNCYAGGNNPDNFAIDNFTLNALNGNVTRDWQGLYEGVANANAVIQNVPAINDVAWQGNTRKQQIIGEAKFLRALHYFYLVTTWGDVPLVVENVTSGAGLYPARTPAAAVWEQIEHDLISADSSLLPASGSNPNNGRATQGAADALLAKAYAQQGKYDSSLVWCNKVMANSYYSLLPGYAQLFDGNHKNTVESIFEIQHGTVSGTTNYGPELLLPYSLTGDTWAKFNEPTNDLIQAYQAENDMVRLNASVYWSKPGDSSGAIPPPYTKLPVPYAYKWKDPGGFNSPDNEIVLRLADIILLKAEALNQTGQTAQAIPLINQIRARVGLPNTTAVSQTDVATAILKERRLELALEGWRWTDLLRAGVQYTINLMNSRVDPSGKPLNYGLTTNKLLWPVPQAERDLDANLGQNPGY
ncbi:RagB/SusD family nutrient uptake outer membrane protein [Puia dinghuensis]|uniref:Membrane protein n=1 Tax=Puia dinghuensis TaxID=1792502 RepID=A0A8J2UG00_9BACT|nr:RagB/SusD family nutrient uptake outer membrane protein [Puia dinghuensis]GGB12170.1 membrane protein [Puia dinghuensis]